MRFLLGFITGIIIGLRFKKKDNLINETRKKTMERILRNKLATEERLKQVDQKTIKKLLA